MCDDTAIREELLNQKGNKMGPTWESVSSVFLFAILLNIPMTTLRESLQERQEHLQSAMDLAE